MRHLGIFLGIFVLLIGCKENTPRRPVEVKSGSFLSQSAERNKLLLEQEEKIMQQLILQDSTHSYIPSSSGSSFYYVQQVSEDAYKAQPDDLVSMRYNILSWNNDTIYSTQEIGLVRYKVDMQELFPGLRSSVKMLAEGETATFLFPSSLGFGYHGDNDRIGPNTPLKCTLSILKIEKNTESNTLN